MEEKKFSIDDLKKMLDESDDEDERERAEFEDLVYHIALDLISRASTNLWLQKGDTLDAKHTITQCLEILKYWDRPDLRDK